ncbi:hypothetical protein [Ktedonobacter sp. SOSP1-85]|uniref:hypothetical protein n=1 Tax=Ktedonobacter sp. SOSP1-85 TaxID=2778367 RepID=UPI001916651F|nr:hypothetical protein [Ktedonobacter sp. SOSP1-85]
MRGKSSMGWIFGGLIAFNLLVVASALDRRAGSSCCPGLDRRFRLRVAARRGRTLLAEADPRK